MRLAIAYDCVFPATRGGAERWLTALARALAEQGHQVTYLTRDFGSPVDVPGVRVLPVARGQALYDPDGVRRTLPALRYAAGLGHHLRWHRAAYDAVYVHQMPLFPVLAARLALAGSRIPWGVEWIEWWSRDYWRRYAPGVTGVVGWWVQRLALAATPQAFTYAARTADRLAAARPALPVHRMPGQVAEPPVVPFRPDPPDPPLVLTVGRLVPEKRPAQALAAMIEVAARVPGARGLLVGAGPLLAELQEAAARAGTAPEGTAHGAAVQEGAVRVAGPVPDEELQVAYHAASVLLHPSAREGFGLVVVEACARGVPVVVVDGPDNAAVELVEPGRNGVVAADDSPQALAAAVQQVLAGGAGLRARSRAWFEQVAGTRDVGSTARAVAEVLGRDARAGRLP